MNSIQVNLKVVLKLRILKFYKRILIKTLRLFFIIKICKNFINRNNDCLFAKKSLILEI